MYILTYRCEIPSTITAHLFKEIIIHILKPENNRGSLAKAGKLGATLFFKGLTMKELIEDIKESIKDNIGVCMFFCILLILWGICVYVKVQDPNAYKSDIKRLQEQVDSIKTILNEKR